MQHQHWPNVDNYVDNLAQIVDNFGALQHSLNWEQLSLPIVSNAALQHYL